VVWWPNEINAGHGAWRRAPPQTGISFLSRPHSVSVAAGADRGSRLSVFFDLGAVTQRKPPGRSSTPFLVAKGYYPSRWTERRNDGVTQLIRFRSRRCRSDPEPVAKRPGA